MILTEGWNATAYHPKDLRKLVTESLPPKLLTMTASQVIDQIKALPPDEQAKVRDWLAEHEDESAELLAAIDVGLSSLERGASKEVKRDELDSKVRQWAGGSH